MNTPTNHQDPQRCPHVHPRHAVRCLWNANHVGLCLAIEARGGREVRHEWDGEHGASWLQYTTVHAYRGPDRGDDDWKIPPRPTRDHDSEDHDDHEGFPVIIGLVLVSVVVAAWVVWMVL